MREAMERVRGILDEASRIEIEKMLLVVEQADENVMVLPHVHLRANQGMGNTTFGKFYAELIKKGKMFGSHDVRYLELSYPYSAASRDYELFFQSLREAAETQNLFWGVVLVSLDEWKRANVKKDEAFYQLLRFVKKNELSVRFVFQTQEKQGFSDIVSEVLREEVDICTFSLAGPNEEYVWKFLCDESAKEGYTITQEGKSAMLGLVYDDACKTLVGKRGYPALQEIKKRLQYECAASGRKDINEMHVNEVKREMSLKSSGNKERKVGFAV